jgi:hypothetical protein
MVGKYSLLAGARAITGRGEGALAPWLSTKAGRVLPNGIALGGSIAGLLFVINGSSAVAFVAAAMLF